MNRDTTSKSQIARLAAQNSQIVWPATQKLGTRRLATHRLATCRLAF